MFEATFVHEGDAIDFTPTVDVAAGEVVVQDSLVGVAKVPIPANTLGALATRGTFDLPKDSATVFGAGQTVYWDDATNQASDTGTIVFGKAVAGAPADTTSVRTLLTP